LVSNMVRTPYGRCGSNPRVARAVAAQGFHVVLQSCRGTAAGTGEFAPMRHERADGLDTVAWLTDQPFDRSGGFALPLDAFVAGVNNAARRT
jgi:predicted acyl esterase